MLTVGDIRRHRQRLSAGALELVGKRLDARTAARAQHDGCAVGGEVAGGRRAKPTAGTGDDSNFVFDVVAHGAKSVLLRAAAERFVTRFLEQWVGLAGEL